ncbi:MAG: recombination mediator RecR [Candidatus Cryptobacteroides sp.]|nr:recombination mediator RecR [Bacteroidales bacterium]
MRQDYPSKLLKDAVEAISSLPGVGSRSALRLALHLLKQPKDQVHRFCDAISSLADEVKYCKVCNMISDSELCSICSDGRRDGSKICVVESVRDVMSIEATGQYRGLYHVLGGIISPINGVAPSDLAIPQLLDRLRDSSAADSLSEGPEVILALSGDVEGETTAFYLYRQIDSLSKSLNLNVRVSTLARGLGFGDDLEYADTLTLGRSIAARQPFKP